MSVISWLLSRFMRVETKDPAPHLKLSDKKYRIILVEGSGYLPQVREDHGWGSDWFSISEDGSISPFNEESSIGRRYLFHKSEDGAGEAINLRSRLDETVVIWENGGGIK